MGEEGRRSPNDSFASEDLGSSGKLKLETEPLLAQLARQRSPKLECPRGGGDRRGSYALFSRSDPSRTGREGGFRHLLEHPLLLRRELTMSYRSELTGQQERSGCRPPNR